MDSSNTNLVRVNGGKIVENTTATTIGELAKQLGLEGNYSVLVNGDTIGNTTNNADYDLTQFSGDVLISLTLQVKGA